MRAKMFAPLLYQINAVSSSGFYFLYAVFTVNRFLRLFCSRLTSKTQKMAEDVQNHRIFCHLKWVLRFRRRRKLFNILQGAVF